MYTKQVSILVSFLNTSKGEKKGTITMSGPQK